MKDPVSVSQRPIDIQNGPAGRQNTKWKMSVSSEGGGKRGRCLCISSSRERNEGESTHDHMSMSKQCLESDLDIIYAARR